MVGNEKEGAKNEGVRRGNKLSSVGSDTDKGFNAVLWEAQTPCGAGRCAQWGAVSTMTC